MRKIRPAIWFFACWFVLQTALGQWNYISKPPQGMHQGAQADRACVAWNYYHESMNFFEPRVSENRATQGIAGMEFPVVNYTAAIFYKIFGFNNFWFRFIVFLIVTFGVFAAWLITGFFIQKNLFRLLLVFGWYLSPLMVFYSANFIPDPVAMSFSMLAWFYFLRFYFNIRVRSSLTGYIIFTALAGLVKITFLTSHIAVLVLFLLYRYRPVIFPLGFPVIRKFFLWFLIPVAPVISWYLYSRWLTNKTGNIHFLQQINPAKNWDTFIDNTKFGFNTWQDSFYSPNYIYIILGSIVLFLILRWKEAPVPALITTLLLGGFAISFIIFNNQYRFHDYYYFLLFPAIFFGMLFLQQIFIEQKNMFIGLFPILMLIGLFYMPIAGFYHSSKMLKARHTEGDYYCQEVVKGTRKYSIFQNSIQKFIPDKSEIISAFDPSPNTSLYLLQKRGIRIAADFPAELTADIIRSSRIQFLVINDLALWEEKYESVVMIKKRLLFKKDFLSLWKLEY